VLPDFDPAFAYMPRFLDRRVGVQLMCRLLDECVFDAAGVSYRPVTPAMRELRVRVAHVTGPVDRWWVDYRSPAPLADGPALETFVLSFGAPYEVMLGAEPILVEHGSLLVLPGGAAAPPGLSARPPTLLDARVRVTLQRFGRKTLARPRVAGAA
jgi:hypothetical protein